MKLYTYSCKPCKSSRKLSLHGAYRWVLLIQMEILHMLNISGNEVRVYNLVLAINCFNAWYQIWIMLNAQSLKRWKDNNWSLTLTLPSTTGWIQRRERNTCGMHVVKENVCEVGCSERMRVRVEGASWSFLPGTFFPATY